MRRDFTQWWEGLGRVSKVLIFAVIAAAVFTLVAVVD